MGLAIPMLGEIPPPPPKKRKTNHIKSQGKTLTRALSSLWLPFCHREGAGLSKKIVLPTPALPAGFHFSGGYKSGVGRDLTLRMGPLNTSIFLPLFPAWSPTAFFHLLSQEQLPRTMVVMVWEVRVQGKDSQSSSTHQMAPPLR